MRDRRFAYAAGLVWCHRRGCAFGDGRRDGGWADDQRLRPSSSTASSKSSTTALTKSTWSLRGTASPSLSGSAFVPRAFSASSPTGPADNAERQRRASHGGGAFDLDRRAKDAGTGLSQKIKAFAGPGTTMNIWFLHDSTTGSCAGDGCCLDGHGPLRAAVRLALSSGYLSEVSAFMRLLVACAKKVTQARRMVSTFATCV